MSANRSLTLEKGPADCWDWITPDDVVRHALAAYYAASRLTEQCDGPWIDEGAPWACRSDFRDHLHGFFRQRVNAQAHALGVRFSSGSGMRALPSGLSWDGECQGGDDPDGPASGTRQAPGCRGGTPTVETHGCVARLTVGPVPTKENGDGDCSTVSALDITLPADPLQCARSLQVLPNSAYDTTKEANP